LTGSEETVNVMPEACPSIFGISRPIFVERDEQMSRAFQAPSVS
jgi:hypothetical protein